MTNKYEDLRKDGRMQALIKSMGDFLDDSTMDEATRAQRHDMMVNMVKPASKIG